MPTAQQKRERKQFLKTLKNIDPEFVRHHQFGSSSPKSVSPKRSIFKSLFRRKSSPRSSTRRKSKSPRRRSPRRVSKSKSPRRVSPRRKSKSHSSSVSLTKRGPRIFSIFGRANAKHNSPVRRTMTGPRIKRMYSFI